MCKISQQFCICMQTVLACYEPVSEFLYAPSTSFGHFHSIHVYDEYNLLTLLLNYICVVIGEGGGGGGGGQEKNGRHHRERS